MYSLIMDDPLRLRDGHMRGQVENRFREVRLRPMDHQLRESLIHGFAKLLNSGDMDSLYLKQGDQGRGIIYF